jgi:hypothetical protein
VDSFKDHDFSFLSQVIASGLVFGSIHFLWEIKNIKVGVNTFISTTLLGFALATVYLVAGLNLALCIVAHIIITALIKSGLFMVAQNSKFGSW